MNLNYPQPYGYASHRYERLIGTLLQYDIVDIKRLEQRLIHHRVTQLTGRFTGRCLAMAIAAREFGCSYEKVRRAVYRIEKHKSNLSTMEPTIKIKNEAEVTTIDIEGTIGISEAWQFDNPESRVATYDRFKEWVAAIADIRNAHIRVNIRSTGGDVNDALLIYEALRSTGAHITTCCYGYTASAATIVAQAASEGCRLVTPTTLYLIHNSLCSVEGNAEELEAEVELLRQTDDRLAEIYATRSGRDKAAIAALMAENGGKGRWLSPAESVAEGLADTIEGCPEEIATTATPIAKAKRGVKALLETLGIDLSGKPDVANDINYIPHNATAAPSQSDKQPSVIALEERQRSVDATRIKVVEDPDLREMPRDERRRAYDNDVKAMRMR